MTLNFWCDPQWNASVGEINSSLSTRVSLERLELRFAETKRARKFIAIIMKWIINVWFCSVYRWCSVILYPETGRISFAIVGWLINAKHPFWWIFNSIATTRRYALRIRNPSEAPKSRLRTLNGRFWNFLRAVVNRRLRMKALRRDL